MKIATTFLMMIMMVSNSYAWWGDWSKSQKLDSFIGMRLETEIEIHLDRKVGDENSPKLFYTNSKDCLKKGRMMDDGLACARSRKYSSCQVFAVSKVPEQVIESGWMTGAIVSAEGSRGRDWGKAYSWITLRFEDEQGKQIKSITCNLGNTKRKITYEDLKRLLKGFVAL